MNARRPFGTAIAALLLLGPMVVPAPSVAAAEPALATVQFVNGDFASGSLAVSHASTSLAWKSPVFAGPVDLRLASISSIQFFSPIKPPAAKAPYAFEISGGDLLFGSLIALDKTEAVLDVPGIGRLHVERSRLRSIAHRQASELLYAGPAGLGGWKVEPNSKDWRDEAGQLLTHSKLASIRRQLDVPAKALFDFEIAWRDEADFDLALGVEDNSKSLARAFHVEVWDHRLVVRRQTEREADVAALYKLEPGPGRLHLLAFLDQEAGRMLVCSSKGQKLADLRVATSKPQIGHGVQLKNHSGDVRLVSLRVSRWNGEAPVEGDREKPHLVLAGGATLYWQLDHFDADKRQFVISHAKSRKSLAEAEVQEIFLGEGEASGLVDEPRLALAKGPSVTLTAALYTGVRLSGNLQKVDQQKLWIKLPGIGDPLGLPLEQLRSIAVVGENIVIDPFDESEQADTPGSKGRHGRLEADGTLLHGSLVAAPKDSQTALAWQSSNAATAGVLAADVSARIIYRDPPPPKKADPAEAQVEARPKGFFESLFGSGGGSRRSSAKPGPSMLHLVTGDVIPCRTASIDEEGVTFTSDVTEATFLGNDRIQALELMPDAEPVKIEKTKKQRLLTLPRYQRDNPPTQLVRSAAGDYLRGRLVAMDENELELELRLETRRIPRSTVARIIWLHPDPQPSAPVAAASKPSGIRVQVLPNHGNRLTFYAQQFSGTTLSGSSEWLGKCHVDIDTIDQLLIGRSIDQAASGLAFHQWKLKPAAEPLPASEGAGERESSEGLDSALVGKPAPNIELDLLGGKKFRLADHKNSILVFDFWASWCGPCLQTLPQVEQVAAEFDGVELISINLEETPDRIKTVLERLQLKMNVALDRDGRVAERYGATSIPQTVIVGRDGRVARVFVGGSSTFDQQLRKALESVSKESVEKKPTEQERPAR